MSERKRPNSRRNLDIARAFHRHDHRASHGIRESSMPPMRSHRRPAHTTPQRKRLCTRHVGPAVSTPKYSHALPPRKTPPHLALSTKTRPQPGRREGRKNVP